MFGQVLKNGQADCLQLKCRSFSVLQKTFFKCKQMKETGLDKFEKTRQDDCLQLKIENVVYLVCLKTN